VVISFPLGLYTVFFTRLSQVYTAYTPVSSIYIFVGWFIQLVPLPGTVGSIFAGVSLLYVAMMVAAALQGTSLSSALKEAFSEGFEKLFSNPLLVTIISTGFLYFTILAIDTVETSGGVPVGGLSGDAMNLFVSLALAPLREEFGFRLLIIGTVAFLVSALRPGGATVKAFWRPSASYEGVQRVALQWTAIGLALAASSLAFGLVHVTAGSGWEIGKLPEATFAGVVLGYMYIRYGFHVAVLMHWGIDYLGSVFAFFGQGAYGIPWTADNGYILQQVVQYDLLALGVASFLAVVFLGLQRYLLGKPGSKALAVEV
jgi:membrane protease YdiL (CAAX protease family)